MLQHIPIAIAIVAMPIATLVGGWRFFEWIRQEIRREIQPLSDRVVGLEKRVQAIPCRGAPVIACEDITEPIGGA